MRPRAGAVTGKKTGMQTGTVTGEGIGMAIETGVTGLMTDLDDPKGTGIATETEAIADEMTDRGTLLHRDPAALPVLAPAPALALLHAPHPAGRKSYPSTKSLHPPWAPFLPGAIPWHTKKSRRPRKSGSNDVREAKSRLDSEVRKSKVFETP